MKKNIFLGLTAMMVLTLFLFSCKKKTEETPVSPNQPTIDQLNIWGDSLTKKIIIDSANLSVQGAIIYVNDPSRNFEYLRAFGTSDISTPRFLPLMTTDLFRIGTITNSFTTTVFLQLVQVGACSLEDRLDKYFPSIPNSSNITLRQIANMTSGLYDFMDSDSIHRIMAEHPLTTLTPQQLVDFAMAYPPNFLPGEGCGYSNTNSVLLGMIIEQVTGTSLSENYRTRILEPLGLSRTTFPNNQFMPFYEPYSHGYEYTDTLHTLTDVTERYNPSWAWGSANLISAISELKIWLPELVNGDLLSPSVQAEKMKMVSWENFHGIPLQYGLGVVGASGYFGHMGDTKGYRCIAMNSSATGTTIMVMVNNGSASPLLMFAQIANLLTPGLFPLTP